MAARRDGVTADLFETPQPAAPLPGSMDYRTFLAELLGEMLEGAKRNGKDRWQVAADVSRLAGREVSKYMLDAYTAPSRDEYNVPAWLMPLFEVACGSHAYTAWIANVRGGRFFLGSDALAAELGNVRRQKDELQDRERAIRDQLRRARVDG